MQFDRFDRLGKRAGHIYASNVCDLPDRCDDGKVYLYLCIFKDTIKIGVSRRLRDRAATHNRAVKGLEGVYAVLVDRADGFRRENQIAVACDGFRRATAPDEWLDRSFLPQAVMMMREPQLLEVFMGLRGVRWELARGYIDPAFAVMGRAQGLDRAEAA